MHTLAAGPAWMAPERIIDTFGLIGIVVIVFVESGLLIGFFLPGDPLLFATGLAVSSGEYLDHPLWLVCALIVVAAVAGDQTGYAIGRRVGPAVLRRPGARFPRPEHAAKAEAFFARHGRASLILARFVPVARTFVPVIAGASRMDYRTFVVFNVLGGVLWGAGVTLLGAGLGQVAFVRDNVGVMLMAVVLLAAVPMAAEYLRLRRAAKRPRPRRP
ncbi:DedA family protein [Streptomyces marincola]|uniref:DedA family protein n=1 Tax=Streptomyces marincola TaxID=2878388 RepID=UPI001CF11ADD|nr:DedA family protein [Streptomyces marincola]UCM89174.1 DedA family protein [Streptomyces marincola]